MPTWFNWSPLSPLLGKYVDDGTRDLCTADIAIQDTGDFQVSLVGNKNAIELIRVATLNSDGNLSPKQSETVSTLVDHTLAVLRLTHDVSADLIRFGENTISIGAHDNIGKPNLSINIEEMLNERPLVSPDNIRNVFVASMEHRHLIKLLADAQTPTLPMQYRYVSLYKILELEFRVARRWIGLQEVLKRYERDYNKMNIGLQTLPNIIHAMRDKCAHIKVGGNDSLGIIGLDGPDAKTVTSLVPLLQRIISDHLTAKYTGLTFQVKAPPASPA